MNVVSVLRYLSYEIHIYLRAFLLFSYKKYIKYILFLGTLPSETKTTESTGTRWKHTYLPFWQATLPPYSAWQISLWIVMHLPDFSGSCSACCCVHRGTSLHSPTGSQVDCVRCDQGIQHCHLSLPCSETEGKPMLLVQHMGVTLGSYSYLMISYLSGK